MANLNVHGLKTGFGELSVSENSPRLQLGFVYGLDTLLYETEVDSSPGTGSVSASGSMGVVQTGTGNGGYARVQTKRFLQYKHGQGGLVRFTTAFTSGIADSVQFMGLYSSENSLGVGYNGTDFSVLRRTGGASEIRVLTVTDGTGSGTATLTLNGTAFSPVLTAGTTAFRAQEIAKGGTGGVTYTGWRAQAVGSTVIFSAKSTGARSGAYSLATVGAGTFAQTTAGAAETESFTAQSSFNLDNLDGTGPSGVTIDPTKGNVYQIQYQWLGFGGVVFSVEDNISGNFVPFHIIRYANQNTTPSVLNPAMRVAFFAESRGSTTNLTVKSASIAAFVQGRVFNNLGPKFAKAASITTSSSTSTPVLSLRQNIVHAGVINFSEIHPIVLSFSSSSTGNKPGVVELWLNSTLTNPLWTYVSQNVSRTLVDTSATAITGGNLIMSFSLASTGQSIMKLNDLNMAYSFSDTLIVAVRSVSGSIDFSVSMGWEEGY